MCHWSYTTGTLLHLHPWGPAMRVLHNPEKLSQEHHVYGHKQGLEVSLLHLHHHHRVRSYVNADVCSIK